MNLEEWESIARKVGAIDECGQECSSSDKSREAIELLLGQENLKEAVHYYISNLPGSALLRGVLWQLHPYSAMEECYKIFNTDENIQSKRDAIELLRVVADRRVLSWVPEFLAFEDEGVQNWAIGIIDQLVFSDLCFEEEVTDILESARSHTNQYVREKTEEILSMLEANKERDDILQAHFENKNA